MARRSCLLPLAVLLLLTGVRDGAAQKRVALVVGNSAYGAVSPLANPKNDATAIAGLFWRIGFNVELALDQSGEAMRGKLASFAEKAAAADIAVVYYAGHGIEVGGVNYLLPVDARDLNVTTIGLKAIALDTVMNALADTRQLKLVILDACRDNPFAAMLRQTGGSRSIGRGLARLEPASPETLVAYAAREGTVAQDGDGTHSPYTEALLRHLGEPDLDIRLALGRVRDDVLRKTNKRQEPFVYGSLGGQVTALVSRQPATTQAPTPQPQPGTQVASVPPPAGALVVPEADMRRIRDVAQRHQIPLPPLAFSAPRASRSLPATNWLGVWVTETEWKGPGRWAMLALTTIALDGAVSGTNAFGPPGRDAWGKNPAGRTPLSGKPHGNMLTVSPYNTITYVMQPDGSLNATVVQRDGNRLQASVRYVPLWRPGQR